MSWLIGYVLASAAAAFFVIRLFDYIFAGVGGGIAYTARLGLFVSTWAMVTTTGMMRDFLKHVRQMRVFCKNGRAKELT